MNENPDYGNVMPAIMIGIGNGYRSDDTVGLLVAKEVLETRISNVVVKQESGEGAALMEAWKGSDNVVIVDAVSSGAEPGNIHIIDAAKNGLPDNFFHRSTHAFGVTEAVELARSMDRLPSRLLIYGIEGKNFGAGTVITPEVRDAAKRVYKQIIKHIKK
jgi:hydrogenase maturation protease